jgi:hypothetical protein
MPSIPKAATFQAESRQKKAAKVDGSNLSGEGKKCLQPL